MAARTSTKVAKAFAARYGIKPSRAMIDIYDSSVVRLSIPAKDAAKVARFDGERKRCEARTLWAPLPSMQWIYLRPDAYSA